ncbi:MAG: hypothetical protein AAFN74_19685, partial [Myxococcota bacterium]
RRLSNETFLCQPQWPFAHEPGESVQLRLDRMVHRLRREVAPRVRTGLRGVQRSMMRRADTAVLRMFAPAESWSSDEKALIEAWHAQLAALPAWPKRGVLLSTLVVEYGDGWFPWSSARRSASRARVLLNDLQSPSVDVQVLLLPELRPIPVEDVDHWVMQEVLPWHCQHDPEEGEAGVLVELMRKTLKASGKSGRQIKMIDLEPVLSKFLSETAQK